MGRVRMSKLSKSIVIYDGDCGICQLLANRAQKLDVRQKLLFLPFQDPSTEIVTRIPPHVYERSVCFISTEKRLYLGARAVFLIMGSLEKPLGPIGLALSKRPLFLPFELVYFLVSKFRRKISLLLGLPNCEYTAFK